MKFDNFHIDDRIFGVKFACDLEKCKGACCTIRGTLGAPVTEEEISIINENINSILHYLSKESSKIIENEGIFVRYDNKLWLNTVNDSECIFSYNNRGIAFCAFQTAYNQNKIPFKKPISCDLFPIRVENRGTVTLRYERFYECEPALEKGKAINCTIFEFVNEAIIKEFGTLFYNKFLQHINKDILKC